MISELAHDRGLEGDDKDFEDQECNTDEDKAEHLTTSVSNLETSFFVAAAEVGYLNIALGGDHHTNVSSEHRSGGTNKEANSGVGELGVSKIVSPGLVDSTDEDTGEDDAEKSEHGVFLDEEGFGTSVDVAGDLVQLIIASFTGPGEDFTSVLSFFFFIVVNSDVFFTKFDFGDLDGLQAAPRDGEDGCDNDDVMRVTEGENIVDGVGHIT